MSDVGLGAVGQMISNFIIIVVLLFVVPAAIWAMARFGVRMPGWLRVTAKTLTILSSIFLLLIFVAFAALLNK